MSAITSIDAIEILDSRGNPAMSVSISLESGAGATAAVPSGASTGRKEAIELRDEDASRFVGNGVLRAVSHVRDLIAPSIIGMEACRQEVIDRRLIDLDGTPNKAHLGANAILGVSMVLSRR